MNEISEKKSKLLKSLNEQFLSNILKIEGKRLILRNHILKAIENLPADKKLFVTKKLSDFGKEFDTEIQIEKFLSDTIQTFFEKMTTYLCGGDKRLTECLWELGDEVFLDIKKNLAESGHEDAYKHIEEFLFTFDDIVRLDDRDIQKILREVDTADLEKALLFSTNEAKEKILKNMSVRAGAMLTEDIKYLEGVPRRDSFLARKTIVNVVYRLAKCREIVIPHFEGESLDDLH